MPEVMTRRMLEQMLFAIDQPLALVRCNEGRSFLSWQNDAFVQLTGFSRAELLERGDTWLVDPAGLHAWLAAKTGPGEFQLAGRLCSGETVQWAVQATPIHRSDTEIACWMLQWPHGSASACGVAASQLATSPRMRAVQLQVAREDAVTGILSRGWFEEMLQHQLGGARRREQPLALMLFEVEHFDIYLQTFGRKTGDACLRLVARAIASAMRRSTDLVARVGNRQFAALAEDMDQAQVIAHGARIREAVEALCIHNPRAPSGRYVSVQCSFTLAVPQADAKVQDWLAPLDEASAEVKPLQRVLPTPVVRSPTGVTTAMAPNAGWSK